MQKHGNIRTFRLTDKVHEDIKKLKKQGQSWDFLFEYLIECYYFRKEKIKKKMK